MSLSFFPVVHREGEHRINLVASNPLNNPEETSIIVYVTKLPACYPPAVTLLGLNSGKVGYNRDFRQNLLMKQVWGVGKGEFMYSLWLM